MPQQPVPVTLAAIVHTPCSTTIKWRNPFPRTVTAAITLTGPAAGSEIALHAPSAHTGTRTPRKDGGATARSRNEDGGGGQQGPAAVALSQEVELEVGGTLRVPLGFVPRSLQMAVADLSITVLGAHSGEGRAVAARPHVRGGRSP